MEDPKSKSHLHTMNIVAATLASLISVVGGVYSLKANIFHVNPTGQLSGFVRDERLARPLRLAVVEVSDLNEQVASTLSTDDDGVYSIKDLNEGNYQVKATAPFHKDGVKRVNVQKGRISTVDFNLVPQETETNEVRPPSPTIEPIPVRESIAPAESQQPEPNYESPYPQRRSPYHYYRRAPPPDEGITQAQPSSMENLAKVGAVLFQQMMAKKKTAQTSSSSSTNSSQ